MKKQFNSIFSYSIVLAIGTFFTTSIAIAQNTNVWLPIGNTGIGTLQPSAKLTVKGTTLLQDLTVTAPALFKSPVTFEQNINSLGIANLMNTVIGGTFKLPNLSIVDEISNQAQLLFKDPSLPDVRGVSLNGIAKSIYQLECLVDITGDPNNFLPTWTSKPGILFTDCPPLVRVGIRTRTPEAALHVNGDAILGSATVNNTLAVSGVIQASRDVNITRDLNVTRTANFLSKAFVTNGLSVGTTSNDFGKLTIGNSDRGAGLFINQQNNVSEFTKLIYMEYTEPSTQILTVQNKSGAEYTAVSLDVSGKFVIKSAANNKIFQLDPNGMLRTRRVRVDAESWADYVFDPNYKLMPLDQLNTYIVEKKHLPSIPSSEEMNLGGMDIAEMNKLLLEKIEELVLYTIQQKNTTDALNAELKILQERLMKLETSK